LHSGKRRCRTSKVSSNVATAVDTAATRERKGILRRARPSSAGGTLRIGRGVIAQKGRAGHQLHCVRSRIARHFDAHLSRRRAAIGIMRGIQTAEHFIAMSLRIKVTLTAKYPRRTSVNQRPSGTTRSRGDMVSFHIPNSHPLAVGSYINVQVHCALTNGASPRLPVRRNQPIIQSNCGRHACWGRGLR
jgi:hypothetical protein